MTDDEIKALIVKYRDMPDDGVDTIAVSRMAAKELAEEALRFRHITRSAEHMPDPEPYPGQPTRYGWSVQWGAWGDQHTTLREAIDQDMRDVRK